jgi:hypothetical protein
MQPARRRRLRGARQPRLLQILRSECARMCCRLGSEATRLQRHAAMMSLRWLPRRTRWTRRPFVKKGRDSPFSRTFPILVLFVPFVVARQGGAAAMPQAPASTA